MITQNNDAENDTTDPESSLQMALSFLAEQQDLFLVMTRETEATNAMSSIVSSNEPREFLDWIIRSLSDTVSMKRTPEESNSLRHAWRSQLCKIGKLLPKLSAFEVHSVATEMVWMGGGDFSSLTSNGTSVTYPCICLLLCTHALQQAPSPTIESRSRRWQSLVCETIRQFQLNWEQASTNEEEEQEVGNDSMDENVPTDIQSLSIQLTLHLWILLWCQHVVPAALGVLLSLPGDASKVAMKCGLIATMTQLVAFCGTQGGILNNNDTDSLLQALYSTFQVVLNANISPTIEDKQEDEAMRFWLYPWCKYEVEASGKYNAVDTGNKDEEDEWNDKDEHDDFETHRNDIIWWASQAQNHEHVVGMNTSYDVVGLATLAYFARKDRAKVCTLSYSWKVWFPHVKSLLLSSQLSGGALGQRIGFTFLEQLLKSTPPSSIAWNPPLRNDTSSPGSPLPLFHLLSNRMLVLSRPDIEDPDQMADLKRQRNQTMFWIKNLLYCYQPLDQVDMVEKLVQDCPYPGLGAMFLDSLRPLILQDGNKEVANKLWKYVGSLLESLLTKYMRNGTLVEIEDLIDRLEIYIGSIAMLQLYLLVKKSLPSADTSSGGTIKWEDQLKDSHRVISKTLQQWETKSSESLPPSAFRVNLLEVSISEILRFAKETNAI